MTDSFWTNPSVIALSRGRDPVEAITEEARAVVFQALEGGWQGPPFDPFVLAELLAIKTVPTGGVLDARTVPLGAKRFRIEFNPDRPRRRMRYSIFHEIAHTLFPDCAETIRNRGVHNASRHDDWQLETLCNMAAAEFLLPTGALERTSILQPSVDTVLELRARYKASAEAALLRILRLTPEPAVAFSCHRDQKTGRYVIEYATPTTGLDECRLRPGMVLPIGTAAAECTAIGYTAKQTERWPRIGQVRVECVGVAPFPRDMYPRVIGFARPQETKAPSPEEITYLRGDATRPRGSGPKLLLQIVNDSAYTWGGSGFATAVRQRWPAAQKSFTAQATVGRSVLRLGGLLAADVEPDITLLSLIAQHGYGPSPRPRIRYGALRAALLHVSDMAYARGASVHMPRLGAGQAGGAWPVVEEIIRETLSKAKIKVFVYDLPQGKEKPKKQRDLQFTS